jgi:signal transduction histidine kinase/ligand-binding sensor domain-containing protein
VLWFSFLGLLLLMPLGSAWATDPPQQLSNDYIRTRFADVEGLSSGLVENMVQSRDGFLWLRQNGTQLTRFDGRHFVIFDEIGRALSMAVAPNGDLWVGTVADLKQIPASALNQSSPLPFTSYHPGQGLSNNISAVRFTRNGLLWVGTARGLYRFRDGAFTLVLPGAYIEEIEEARNGHLWITTRDGPIEWDGSQVVSHPELEIELGVKIAEIFHVFEDSHGVTWFCTKNGVARTVNGVIEKLASWGPKGRRAVRGYEDPRGRVWFAREEGLFRATTGGLELVAPGMIVRKMFGDESGDLWVGTNGDGLFRFKERAVRMFTTADGLPGNIAMTVLVTHDGTLWSGFNCGGITRFDGHSFQVYNEKNGLRNSCVWSLAEDANHDLWIGTYGGGLFRFHDGSFSQYSKDRGLATDVVENILAVRDGSLWFIDGTIVDHMIDGHIRHYTQKDGLSSRVIIRAFEDQSGGIWARGFQGTDHLQGDRFARFSLFPNSEMGMVGGDRAGGLYFMIEPRGGFFRVANSQIVQLPAGFDADGVLETPQGDLWFTGDRIDRIPPGVVDHPHQPDDPFDFESFSLADGLATTQSSGGHPVSALTPDGKLWLATNQGIAMLDLPRLPKTDRKPALYVEGITVGRNSQPPGHELTLPAGTHHVELNFDAIEISAPEKIRLQYRLDGVDSEWLDASAPARAIYSNIPPGRHAFHIRACNRSGIWDRVGTAYYVTQQPYFYQTRIFLVATIAFGLLLIAGGYQLRLRQVVARLNLRLEERVNERTRIARELHDTLLQTFSASLLRFQSVLKMLPARPEEAKQRVENAIEQASAAIAEGRDAVHQLRVSGLATGDLAQSINNVLSELVSSSPRENRPEFHIQVEGATRDLSPMVRDEVYRITAEALRNAIRHAAATQIEVDIRYDEQQLRVRIRDNGKGVDPGVLESGHVPGHWGLHGMRERAKLLGGNFELWSEMNSGTEVELTVPAVNAYSKPTSRWPIFKRR